MRHEEHAVKSRILRPHIRLFEGQWYAFGGDNALLYCAIGFCQRLNRARAKVTS